MLFYKTKAKGDNGDSLRALLEARQHVLEVKTRGPEVKIVASALRRARETNHFAQQIETLMGG